MKTLKTHRTVFTAVFALVVLMAVAPRESAALTIIDPFTNAASWSAPFVESGKNLVVTNGRMNFISSTTSSGGGGIARSTPFLTTTQDWSIKVDVHINAFTITGEDHSISVFLGVGKTSDWLGTHVLLGFDRDWWYPDYYGVNDDVQVNGSSIPGFTNVNYLPSGDASLRLDHNAANHTLSYYYDSDGSAGGAGWTFIGTTNIASGTYNLLLSPTDTLTVLLGGYSELQVVTNGQAYLDNLEITISAPANPTINDYTYVTNSGAITITGYTGTNVVISIPSVINGLPVTSIGTQAFKDQSSLSDVTIPNGVTEIGDEAFYSCSGLTNVVIPASASYIGYSAFDYCSSLVHVILPSGVTFLGDYAFDSCINLTAISLPTTLTDIGNYTFWGCLSLTNISIPANVANIGAGPFGDCPSLVAINVNVSNLAYSSVGGVLFNDDQSVLIQCPGARSGNYTVPNTVDVVGAYAFTGCDSLLSITIPDGVSVIEYEAFWGCAGLTNVTLGKDVAIIVGDSTFAFCPNLVAITVNALNSTYSSLDGVLFNKAQTELIAVPGGKTGGYSVPNTVTNIADWAFESCAALTRITIPSSVTRIGYAAFYECNNLTSLVFSGNAPSTQGDFVFYGSTNVTIYYLPGSTGWGALYGGRPTALWNPIPQTSGPSFGIKTNRFGFNITGTANIPIVVEATTNSSGGPWIALLNGTLTNGLIYFSDPQWTNYPRRFYRIRSP